MGLHSRIESTALPHCTSGGVAREVHNGSLQYTKSKRCRVTDTIKEASAASSS